MLEINLNKQMKILLRIFYALILSSGVFYGCETVAPETVDPSLVVADRLVNEFVNLQSETQDILNIVADVLIRNKTEITDATTTPSVSTFDDCSAEVTIVKTAAGTTQITINFTNTSCNAAITQKVRQGKITVNQVGTLGYLDAGHEMQVTFTNFQLNTRVISGSITVKNVSKSALTVEDTVKQQLNYNTVILKDNGTQYQITNGYQERGLISGLVSRSIGDDVYWADSTNYIIKSSDDQNYTITHDTTTNSSITFNFICWQSQVFFPNQGNIQITPLEVTNGDFTANVDFGTGACDPFKTITLQ